jgi:hypothetical protein
VRAERRRGRSQDANAICTAGQRRGLSAAI